MQLNQIVNLILMHLDFGMQYLNIVKGIKSMKPFLKNEVESALRDRILWLESKISNLTAIGDDAKESKKLLKTLKAELAKRN